MEKKIPSCLTCSGILNCSPPKAATHGLIPPLPKAMRNRPMKVKGLKENPLKMKIKNKMCKFYIAGMFHGSIDPNVIVTLPIT